MSEDFYKKYNYTARAPYFIERDNLTDAQWKRLTESDTFCMLPWTHMHAFPDGRAYPCCLSDYWHPVGDLRKNTMEEIWNHDAYKTMRKNMLEDKPCKECAKCYEREEHGAFSMRNDANRNYGHHIAEVDNTHEDGTNPEFKMRYWDVRFSNLCNMKCRSCSPVFSSQWYNDHIKLYGNVPDVLNRPMARIEYTTGDEDGMLAQMEEHIPYLEQVYFAGGEPLIMKEHYYLLEKLIEHGKTDVRIQYNTNFSELRFKDKHVFDYWKHFKNISVGASLDASGARAELIRKGTDWKQTVDNRIRLMNELPHVDFYVSSTVSSMNVLHVLDFHKEWTELGLVKAKDWNVNICQSPDWYRADIFPQEFKDNVIKPAYEEHIAWLESQDKLERATGGFKSMLSFIMNNDGSKHWEAFKTKTATLDAIRNENFWTTFTEYKGL
jgi:radical SAM protein with 4Fe4S-binding SPASM domain